MAAIAAGASILVQAEAPPVSFRGPEGEPIWSLLILAIIMILAAFAYSWIERLRDRRNSGSDEVDAESQGKQSDKERR